MYWRPSSHSLLLRCGWLWVGFNLCLFWDYLCLLYPENTSCLCRGCPVPTSIFYLCQKYQFKDANKIFKIFYGVLKPEWGLQDKYWLSWETSLFGVFFSWTFDVLLGVTYWWPLSDHWSVSLTNPGLCGMEVWVFKGAIFFSPSIVWQVGNYGIK